MQIIPNTVKSPTPRMLAYLSAMPVSQWLCDTSSCVKDGMPLVSFSPQMTLRLTSNCNGVAIGGCQGVRC